MLKYKTVHNDNKKFSECWKNIIKCFKIQFCPSSPKAHHFRLLKYWSKTGITKENLNNNFPKILPRESQNLVHKIRHSLRPNHESEKESNEILEYLSAPL